MLPAPALTPSIHTGLSPTCKSLLIPIGSALLESVVVLTDVQIGAKDI